MSNNKIGKLLGQTAIYGLSSIIGRFLNYLLVPLYTYKIAASSGGYGVVTNIYAYTGLLLVLLTFGMETTFFRFATKENADPKKSFSTAALSVLSVAIVFLVLIFSFLRPITSLIGYNEHPEYVGIMAVVVALDAFQAILFAELRYKQKAIKFATLKLLFIVLNIAFNLFIFLVAPGWAERYPDMMSWYDVNKQISYVFWVNLISTATVTFGFIPEIRELRYGIDFGLLKSMLKYTWPLLLLGLTGILNQVADKICFRYLVPGLEGEVQLGIYGACVKVAMIMAMITQAFRYAYEPFVFSGGKDPNSREMQADVMKYFIIFTLLAYIAVIAYMPLLRYIIKSDYWGGLKAVPIVMMAEIFMGIYFNLSFWYKLIDQTWWGAIFSAIGCAALLAVNIIFVPRYGYMACAWGGFIGYGICMILSYTIGQKKSRIPYDLKSAALYFVIACLLSIVIWVIKIENTILSIALNTLILMVYVVVVALREKQLTRGIITFVNTKILKHR